MSWTIVTTFHKAGYEKYGKRMLETINTHFPKDIRKVAYYENMDKPTEDGWEYIEFQESCGVKQDKFAALAKPFEHSVLVEGIDPRNGQPIRPGNRYLFEATRFAHKYYAMEHAHKNNDNRYLIWCDADVIACEEVQEEWLQGLVEQGKLWSRVGRDGGNKIRYPECGFMIWDTQHENYARYWQLMEWLYDEAVLFKLEEWHDSYVWWTAEKYVEQEVGHSVSVNLGDGYSGHAFVKGRLGEKLDHLKGARKDTGFSEERKWNNFDEETKALKRKGIKV